MVVNSVQKDVSFIYSELSVVVVVTQDFGECHFCQWWI